MPSRRFAPSCSGIRRATGPGRLLATVLDLQGNGGEAAPLLQTVLASHPDSHDARYLLGKILLAQGKPADAVEQLVEARPPEAG